MSTLPPPIPRLDPKRLIHALADEHGITVELLGATPGGEVGAAYVRWPDGRVGVLKTAGDDDPTCGERLRRTAAALELARAAGVPVPRYDLIAPVAGTHVLIQERLPGAAPTHVDGALVDRVIAATDGWVGLLAGFDAEPAPLYLRHSGPGFCVHASLERYDGRTRRLLGRVREVGRSGPDSIVGDDLVHLDYHLGNVLIDEAGTITGIIDWDFASRGDRWFAVATLGYDLAGRRADPALLARVDELLIVAVPPDRLRAYAAHLALRQVDWVIRHHGSDAVDFWLEIAEHRLR